MLTEKCPFCGSFNDVNAAECYFCHKELPDTPGHKKKRSPKKEQKQSITLPSPTAGLKRKSPPGCLIMLCVFLFVACAAVAFQYFNNDNQIIDLANWLPASEAGSYVSYYLQETGKNIIRLWEYPAIAICSIAMVLILCYGLLNLRKWARALGLMLFLLLLAANFALFVSIVRHYDGTPIGNINFIAILLGIGLNIYCLAWLFEHKKTFE
ncbi:MAG: hypothetical protein JW929_12570 [Anaerolineales bacterium]|nr:hypothetical protein [Anaerolineales bacterium]